MRNLIIAIVVPFFAYTSYAQADSSRYICGYLYDGNFSSVNKRNCADSASYKCARVSLDGAIQIVNKSNCVDSTLESQKSPIVDCKLNVKNRSTGVSETNQLELSQSDSSGDSKIYGATIGKYVAVYEITANETSLNVGDMDGNGARSVFDVNSNKPKELKLVNKSDILVLSCKGR